MTQTPHGKSHWHSHLETSCLKAASQFESPHLVAVNQCGKESVWRHAFSISSEITTAHSWNQSRSHTRGKSHMSIANAYRRHIRIKLKQFLHQLFDSIYRKVWNFETSIASKILMAPMAHSWNQFLGHKFRGVELVRLRFVIYREETKRMVFHDNRQFFHVLNLRGIPCSRPAYRFINVAMAEPLWTLDSRVPLRFGMGIYLKYLEITWTYDQPFDLICHSAKYHYLACKQTRIIAIPTHPVCQYVVLHKSYRLTNH